MNWAIAVTLARVGLSVMLIYCLRAPTVSGRVLALGVFVLAALTDYWDGWLARACQQQSSWGAFLDPLADKCLILAALWSFVVLELVPLWMVALITLRELGVTLLRARLRSTHDIAAIWSGKQKTVAQMVLVSVMLGLLVADAWLLAGGRRGVMDRAVVQHAVWIGMAWTTLVTLLSGGHLLRQWQRQSHIPSRNA